jgi:type VI secretion system ImpC/EvpB family protein
LQLHKENVSTTRSSSGASRCIKQTIRRIIAALDSALTAQISEILHHPDFEKLFSTWNALRYLTSFTSKTIKVKILDIRWKDIQHLVDTGDSIDNPLSFKIFNEQEAFGAEPLSLLITDEILDVSKKATVETLEQIAQTSAYAFLPFVAGISARLLDCKDFSNLDYISLEDIHRSSSFFHLSLFAKQTYSAFVGLVLPEVIYPTEAKKIANFLDMQMPKSTNASGAFAFAAKVMKSFAESGWFLDVLGMPVNNEEEIVPIGAVPKLKSRKKFTNSAIEKIACFASVPFAVSEAKEKALSEIGLIAFSQERQKNLVVLHRANTVRSLYHLKEKDELYQIQYLLCVCRFAHYIRAIGRAKVGQFIDMHEMETYLNNWLAGYIASNLNLNLELKRRYPLLIGKVVLSKNQFFQTSCKCSLYLRPHVLSSGTSAGITLRTDMALN